VYYSTYVTIPAATAEKTPIEVDLKLTKGVIHRVEVTFRSGTDFRAAIRIRHQEHQLYPTNPEGDLKDDGRTIVIDDYFPLTTAPYSLKLIGYAPTAAYEHIVYVKVGVLRAELISPVQTILGKIKGFMEALKGG